MFEENSSLYKYGLTALALVGVAGTAYWLSRDPIVFDRVKHSKSNLKRLLHELFIEHATLYCEKMNLISLAKKEGRFSAGILDNLKAEV